MTEHPTRKRAVRGAGSLRPDPQRPGRWRALFTPPRHTGEARKSKRFLTEAEGEAWLAEQTAKYFGEHSAQAQARPHLATASGTMTMRAYAEDWIVKAQSRNGVRARPLTPSTARNYRSSLNNWWDTIGGLPLNTVGRRNVQAFVARLRLPNSRGKVISPMSQHREWRFLASVLRSAIAEGLVPLSALNVEDAPATTPTGSARIRANVQTRRGRVIPKEDFASLVSAAAKSDTATCSRENHYRGLCGAEWYLAMTTAIRQGERTALLVQDVTIDVDEETGSKSGMLTVQRHTERIEWKHGCGQVDAEGSFPCGKRQARACPSGVADGMQGETAMGWVPGTKSHRADAPPLRIPLDFMTAELLDAHIRALKREGIRRRDAMLFGGAVVPPRPWRGPRQTDEQYALKVAQWEERVNAYQRDPLTIRTPDQDLAAWREFQRRNLPEERQWDYGVHDIRHSTLTHLAEDPNTTLFQLQALANHASASTTQYYIDLRAEHLRGISSKIGELGTRYALRAYGVDLTPAMMARSNAYLETPGIDEDALAKVD